jgi:4-amino-4-deoxy-L-arabinose transferase-like glycosyltransferase
MVAGGQLLVIGLIPERLRTGPESHRDGTRSAGWKSPDAWPRWIVPVALLVILVGAAVVRLIGIAYDYPFLLEIDESIAYQSAVRMLAAHSIDPHFYYYGPLLIYLEDLWLLPYLAVQSVLGHPGVPFVTLYNSWAATTSDPLMHVYGRLPFVAIGVAAVFLAFLVARRLGGPWAGLLAAAFLALLPLHVEQSHFFLANAPTSFFALLTIWFSLRHLQANDAFTSTRPSRWGRARLRWLRGESTNLLGAAGAAALGTAVKYNAVILILVPLAVVYLERESNKKSWLGRSAGLCAVATAVFLLVTPPVFLSPHDFVHQVGFQLKHYHNIGGQDHTPSVLWNAQYMVLYGGYLTLPIAMIGLTFLVWRERKGIDLVLFIAIVGYYFLLSVQKAHYDRNLLIIFPLVFVACASVLTRVVWVRKPFGPPLALGATLIILFSLGRGTLDEVHAYLSPQPQIVVYAWLDAHLPHNAHLLADGYTVPALHRKDVSMTYKTDTYLTPDQLQQKGIQFAVISKSLGYYSSPAARRSKAAWLRPIYRYRSIVVYAVLRRGS